MQTSEAPDPPLAPSDSGFDPYRGVVVVLVAVAALGTAVAGVSAMALAMPVLIDVALALGVSVGILIGVAVAQAVRTRPLRIAETVSSVQPPRVEAPAEAREQPVVAESIMQSRVRRVLTRMQETWSRDPGEVGNVRVVTAVVGLPAVLFQLAADAFVAPPDLRTAAIGVAACLIAAGLAGAVVHYLAGIDPDRLPEGPGLCRGARVLAWIFVLAGAAIGLAWAGEPTIVRIVHVGILAIVGAVCVGLFWVKPRQTETLEVFPLDLGVLSMLGSRTNVFASILDAGERQLGIDLRSTWALTVVRRSVEPLAIGLCLVGWLSTSLTVVKADEQGLVERLGTPVGGLPLEPGLHVHWPWPVDDVFRIPVRRVQMLSVGHEGQEEGGPEDVLWARQHAANEYTLLLGNGRDLITVDAAVQFRIADPRAWRYHSQNPGDALRAIAYRAVMRTTVNRTLADALSENVVTTTARMRTMVQQDADALGLGVDVLGFTVGGMHPPVPVASAYQAVVSAELRKVTEVIKAQAVRNETVPAAEAASLMAENAARAQGTDALARSTGEAWAFLALQAQYRAAPEEYFFRRRLETLEKNLAGRRFVVVDSRFQRDGGVLWLTP